MVMVGEVGGLGIMISCDGWEGPLCCNEHVCGRASCYLMMIRHLGSSCLASC
jgi:hypothetical protein